MAEETIIDIVNLSVSFERVPVLRNITLSIPRGQTVAIIGESGCGKTVLLKTMIGLVRPTMGEATFDGQDFRKMSQVKLAEQRTRFGFLFQHAALFDSMTIGQNVAFPLRHHTKLERWEIRERVTARLAEVGLSDAVLSKKPAELSGGMRKRVGLARALALDPEVMLYDEPTTGLDPIMGDVINELIVRTRQRRPVTSIVVTHDMRTVSKTADRVVMIFPLSRLEPTEPQVIFDGTPKELQETTESRIWQFVRGEAGERLLEMSEAAAGHS